MASWTERLFGRRRQIQASDDTYPRSVAIEYKEIGSSGTDIFSGYFSEEYLQNLRGRQAADLWDQMRRGDPKIKMALSAIKNPILGAHWAVNPADDSDTAKLHAEFIEKVFFQDLNWTQSLSEILTMLDFGFSVFEVTHKVCIADPKFGSHIGLRKLGWRSPRTVETWNVDSCGELESITQFATGDLQRFVDIPAEYLVVFSYNKEGDNYEGVSALRPCYGPWKRKQTLLKLMIVGVEKHAFQVPILTIPNGQENSATTTRAKAVLEAYLAHQSQYITKPEGYTLELSKADFDPDPILNAVSKEDGAIAYAFLENFLELGQGGSGSYALSYDLSDFFLVSIEHVANYVTDVLNRGLVRDLIHLNFGPQTDYPELSVSGIRDKPGKELAETLKALIDAKAVVPDGKLEEDLRERYGLPPKSLEDQRVVTQPGQAPTPSPTAPVPSEQAAEPTPKDPCAPDPTAWFAENGSFKVQAIEVSKKVALTQTDAARIVQDFGLDASSAVVSEFAYRYEQCAPVELVQGSLKSFEPMEGVTIYYGRGAAPLSVDQK